MPADPPTDQPVEQRSDEDFGPWVRRAREHRGWTAEELAELADVVVAQVHRVEGGGVLRQHSTRARLRTVLETGKRYAPPESFTESPAVVGDPARRRARAAASGPPTPLERLATHAELLGAPREGGNLATQASALARWVTDQTDLWDVRISALLPGVGAIPERPSAVSRTLRTHEILRTTTSDAWAEVGDLTLTQVTELPRGNRRMAVELLETAAVGWARLPG